MYVSIYVYAPHSCVNCDTDKGRDYIQGEERVLAYLRNIAGSVPNQRNKASHTTFFFPSAHKIYVYCSLLIVK
jgi:hypothetical protein